LPSNPTHADQPLTDEDSERQLLKRAQAGEQASIAAILRAQAPLMLRIVRGVLGNPADVEDGLQQSMIGLVQALPGFRGECAIAGFAGRIAFRSALSIRRTRRRAQRMQGPEEALMGYAAEGEAPDAFAQARMDTLRSLLLELPIEQAEALALRVVLGFSLDEIADAAGAPLNTIRSRIRLAKEALRARIEADPKLWDLREVSP
jgi:RNA polymerase sigma factor (sigma-70 family)